MLQNLPAILCTGVHLESQYQKDFEMGASNRAEPVRFYVAESKLTVFDGEK
jgi:hypothetical protein